jgi:hypothetical protein
MIDKLIIGGRMSGLLSSVVDLFAKDYVTGGKTTTETASTMTEFNPDASWSIVQE